MFTPQLIAIAVVLLGLVGTHWKAYTVGKDVVQAEWTAQLLADERELRRMEAARLNNVLEAQNAATRRKINLEAVAAAARLDAGRLRDALQEAERRLRESPLAACRQYGHTVSELLAECTTAYQDVATKSDGHASDVRTLLDAWPGKVK